MRRDKAVIDELVRQYADAERSNTFVSYNDAILLAREVRRLRRMVARRDFTIRTLKP